MNVANLFAPIDPRASEPVESDPLAERLRRQRDTALGYRLFGAFRWGDLGDGHISARDPIRTDCLWLLRYGVSFHEATVADLVLIDANGEVVEGDAVDDPTVGINPAAHHIHTPVHQARPDVVSAAHTHTPWGTPFSAEVRLFDPISQEACSFYENQVVWDDEEVQVFSTDGGRRIAQTLGSRRLAILRNHGLLTVGASVAEAVGWYVLAERVAEVHVKMGDRARPIGAAMAGQVAADLGTPNSGWHLFQYLIRRHIPDPTVVG
ncbi:MAG: ribulose phosphate epimerase [Actinomycetia bacterium]|nr:ribulose phosphate epimerase [Actinomycetes bacterium]